MSTERERFEETRAIAQAFINRLSRIANKREYDYLKPLFDRKTYEAHELEFLTGEISGSLWNYTFFRLSQMDLDLRVTREPTSRN
ncbi:hypothetical protein HYW39_01595, partial [Candidatus Curtissbacteria bacterium]|nr:hypothetical protein [Candidatus Curtissbacteria bacterium]